jgi:NAD(P)-dependent dehydrogenase (short-subunit alcohol dehydrogenase family)
MAVGCDVGASDQLDGLRAAVLQRWGRIDILVCNAGVAPHMGPLADASDADYDRTMEINLRSAMRLCNKVIPDMVVHGGGSVVIVSSIAGVRGNKALGLYGMSKAAGAQLARNLAVEWGPDNVRVNAVSPGVITTDFARDLTDSPEVAAVRLGKTPLRRFGGAEEVAATIVFLSAPSGAFITGQNLIIDGGTTISD